MIDSLTRGGAEQHLVDLLPALRGQQIESEVAVLSRPYDLAGDLERRGILVHRLGLRQRSHAPLAVAALCRVIRSGRFDVVHAHLFYSSLYVGLSRAICPGPKRVIELVNLRYDAYPANTLRRRYIRAVEGLVMRNWTDSQVAICEAVGSHYRRHLGLRRLSVIPLAIDTGLTHQNLVGLDRTAERARIGIGLADLLVLVPARFVPEKGHRHLLDAVARLGDIAPIPCFLLVGGGPLEGQIKSEIDTRGLGQKVRIQAPVAHRELLRLMAMADVVALPSVHEGMPVGILEALLLERAVVASRVGGIPEVLSHGSNGLLVPPADPVALANALASVLDSSALRAQLGSRGRIDVERRFEAASVAATWRVHYDAIKSRTD